MLSKIRDFVVGAVAALLLFMIVLKQAMSSGEDKADKDNLEEVLKNVDHAKKVDDNTNDMSVDDRINRMRERSSSK